MTANQWETATDPLPMLERLFPIQSENSTPPPGRKLRLYYVACARRVWDRLPWVCRGLVGVAEDAADRPNDDRRLRAHAGEVAEQLVNSCGWEPEVVAAEIEDAERQLRLLLDPDETITVRHVEPRSITPEWDGIAQLVYGAYAQDTSWHRRVPAALHSADLIRDVFGSPFPPLPQQRFRRAWQTSTTVALARPMYDGRDFTALPILGDALQDAGCDDPVILAHCHDRTAVHARGCWVVDLVLGKK